MKALIATILALLCGAAMATGKPPVQHPSQSQAQGQQQSQHQAQTAAGGQGYGGSATNNSGDAWAVALPGHGSPSYAGQFSICVRGRGILWNAFWTWEPDPDCVRLIAEVTRVAATPVPMPPVAILTAPTAAQPAEAACAPPAKAKSVAAAKAAGACKS